MISYSTTSFREPDRISEQTYHAIKQLLKNSPHKNLDPEPETFTKHFGGSLKFIGISFIVMLLGFGFGEGTPFMIIGGISMIAWFISIFYLILEGPSYATYLKKKKEYFERLKYAIMNSTDYYSFINMFYHRR